MAVIVVDRIEPEDILAAVAAQARLRRDHMCVTATYSSRLCGRAGQ